MIAEIGLGPELRPGNALKISPSTILKIEIGTRGAADYEVVAFARALSVRADWLLGLTDDKTP